MSDTAVCHSERSEESLILLPRKQGFLVPFASLRVLGMTERVAEAT